MLMWVIVLLIASSLLGFGLIAFGLGRLPQVRVAYWLATGAVLGIGLSIFGLGLLPYLLGIVLALYGVYKIGPGEFPLALLSMGLTPLAIIVYNYITSDQSATSFPDNYFVGTAPFVVLALIGAVWGVLNTRRRLKTRS